MTKASSLTATAERGAAAVSEPEVDLVDHQMAPARGRHGGDAREFVAGDSRAGGIGRRGDEHAARGRSPVARHQFGGELVVAWRRPRPPARLAFEGAHEMPVARIVWGRPS